MLNASREHLSEAGETYFQHMRFALTVGLMTIGAGLACILHGIVPALCTRSCSRTLDLLQELLADRAQLDRVAGASSGVLVFVILIGLSSATALVTAVSVGSGLLGALVIVQAYALPLIYLAQNPGLDPLTSTF